MQACCIIRDGEYLGVIDYIAWHAMFRNIQ